MLEGLYTTKMSADKKTLQKRFFKIRLQRGRSARLISLIISASVTAVILFATIAAAAFNEEKSFFINGKGYAIKPILIENVLATHTDNYYVPLRKTFEALGYKVAYDVDKARYQKYIDYYTFPAYDTDVRRESRIDDELYIDTYNSFEWQRAFVTDDIDRYIYGATFGINTQMPIIEMSKDGVTEFCQIGSRKYSSNAYALAPVLIDGTAYIPLRAVATMLGGIDNVKWNDAKHDTYFEGILTFDEAENTITVNLEQ